MGLLGKGLGKLPAFNVLGKFSGAPVTLVISLGADYLKIGYARGASGKVSVEGVTAEGIEKKSDAEIAQILYQYCQDRKITPAQAFCILSPKQFIFKNVDIPSTEKEEIAKIIDLQAGRFTPYMREEIVIDFLYLDSFAQHYTSVLLFIVNHKIAERFPAIFEMAGLHLDKVIVASECMAEVYRQALRGQVPSGAVGGLHVGEDYSELTVIDGNQIVFVRGIPVGAALLQTNASQSKSDFVTELNASINAYQDQGVGKPIQKILLTGLSSNLTSLEEDLKSMGGPNSKTVEISRFDYREFFTISDSVKTELEQKYEISFFEIFSASVHAAAAKINLLLREVKLKRQVQEGGKDVMILGILIMAIFLLVCMIMGSSLYFKRLGNQTLEVAGRKYEEEARRLEAISTKNRVVKKLLDSRGKELLVLNVVNGFVGDDLYLSRVNYDSDGKVSLGGTAASMSRVFAFVTQLRDSNYFSSVETKETQSRKDGKQDVADFVIDCTLAQGF